MKVVYGATRNLYRPLRTAFGSLLIQHPKAKVICIIEDDELPYEVPKNVSLINAEKVEKLPVWLKESGPNYNSVFTYMSMLRLCLSKLLPEEDEILWLDVDTLIVDDISQLLNFDMGGRDGWTMAAVPDIMNPLKGEVRDYCNTGVVALNLQALRCYGIDDAMLKEINTVKRLWPDQDVINLYCNERKLVLPVEYNDFASHSRCFEPKIVHWAGIKTWWNGNVPQGRLWERYENIIGESL